MATSGKFVGSQPGTLERARSPSLLDQVETLLSWCEKHLERRVVWWAAVGCAALFQAALILEHRPWLDEWQALLIARDTPSLSTMLAQLHYEGHPQLWYLVLRAIGSAVPNAWAFTIVNALLAALTWWAIVARSPFRRVERLLLVTNEILLFEMLTVSRSMTLGVALIFLALALWRSRLAWIAIALLPLCDFFFGVIACALVALRLRDRTDVSFPYGWASLFAACSLLAASAVIPAPDVLTTPARGLLPGCLEFLRQLGTLAFPWQTDLYDTPLPILIGLLLAPVFLYLCVRALDRDRLARLLLFAFLGLLLLFGCAIYPVYFRHTALAAVLLIGFVWVAALNGRGPDRPFRAWLFVASLCGLATGTLNLLLPFDTAAQAAAMIRQHKLEKKLWFSFPTFKTLALTGESGVAFGDLERGCAIKFMRWNFRSAIRTHAQFFAAVAAAQQRYGSYYLVTDVPLPPNLATPLGTAGAGFSGVRYNLWKVGFGPVRDADLPLCVPMPGQRAN